MTNKTLKFVKMAGAGNDFVIMDAVKGLNYKRLAVKVCDRSTGIGADGLIILDASKKADYRMRIINADGSEAEMCGNGARCLAAYIVRYKKPRQQPFSMETLAGVVLGEANGEVAEVHLSDPMDYADKIPLKILGRNLSVSYIDTGVPHVVMFVEGLEVLDLRAIAPMIRNHKKFQPRGANVNFVEQMRPGLVHVRTYERGVEDETKACGTGSVASAIVTYLKAHPKCVIKKNARMRVRTASGEILYIKFDYDNNKFTNVWLKGSAKFVAKGEYYA